MGLYIDYSNMAQDYYKHVTDLVTARLVVSQKLERGRHLKAQAATKYSTQNLEADQSRRHQL